MSTRKGKNKKRGQKYQNLKEFKIKRKYNEKGFKL
jgi:hypothetical protein